VTLIRASDWEEESHVWLIPGLVGSSITLLSGEPKLGKTLLAGFLVQSLINQVPILGRDPKPGTYKVAWIGYDSHWGTELKERFPEIHHSLFFQDSPIRFDDDLSWNQLETDLINGGFNLLVVDHLYGLAAELDLDESHFMAQALAPLKHISDELKIPVLLLAHANKSGGGRAAHSILLEAQARHFIRIKGQVTSFNRSLILAGNHEAGTTLKIALSPDACTLKSTDEIDTRAKRNSERNGELISRAKDLIERSPLEARLSATAAGCWMAQQGFSTTDAGGRTLVNKLLKGGLLQRGGGNKSQILAGHKLVT
jgi:hypothetical protein